MCGQIVRKAKSGLIVIVMEHCDGRIVQMCVPPPAPPPYYYYYYFFFLVL